MTNAKPLPWQDPLILAPLIDTYEHGALLYSGDSAGESTRYSYLCLGAEQVWDSGDLEELKSAITIDKPWHKNLLIGWLGYGLKNQLEDLPKDAPAPIETNDFCFFKPRSIYVFDHESKTVEPYGEHLAKDAWQQPPALEPAPIYIKSLHSNMTTAEYLAHVKTILEAIHAGTVYQANLTRKFFGELENTGNKCSALFTQLCKNSPAAYSAYIKVDDLHILSSSPELFIHVNAHGKIKTRPIKGTISRCESNGEDAQQKQKLAGSAKDRAENLMIVDLMRNDLSRVCKTGSVKVDALFDITTHAHIHHMSSLISGQLQTSTRALDAALACFPPGSMTGAPKIKAMEICSQLEKQRRGIYSGALGMFGGDGSAHLNVVIRTLLLRDNQFEFQVGGGIVADSIPQKELEETYHKARAICDVLGISREEITQL